MSCHFFHLTALIRILFLVTSQTRSASLTPEMQECGVLNKVRLEILLVFSLTVACFAVNVTFICNTGEIRLVGGTTQLEGRVEVCFNNEWGTVCDEGWDDMDAAVTCSLRGFYGMDSTFFLLMSNLFCMCMYHRR